MDIAQTLSNALIRGALALLVAWWSYRRGWLSTSGACAAAAVGTAIFASGFVATGALLFFFFSAALCAKLTRSSRVVGTLVDEQSSARTAYQVLAVGAFPALGAVASAMTGDSRWLWGGLCALDFATADTWATEWGQTYRGSPRLLGFGRKIPPGLSGGVTLRGILAAAARETLLAALGVAGLYASLREWVTVAGIGWVGSLLDSVLGATLQARLTCSVCGRVTERRKHCGRHTTTQRRGLSNEGVNFVVSGLSLWLGLVLIS